MNGFGIHEQEMNKQEMNGQEINGKRISELGRLENLSGEVEKNPYRLYYFENPAAYDSPIRSWEEFRGRFSTEIAKEEPTPVKGFLSEKEIFPNEDVQVYCFKNVRFCPPFLHKLEFIKIVCRNRAGKPTVLTVG